MNEEHIVDQPAKRSVVGIVVAALLGTSLAAFIVQNTDSTPLTWLWIERSAPLWAIIFVSALAGAVLSEAIGWLIRRARRHR